MKIEILSTDVQQRTVRSKRDGKEYTFYTQEGFLHDGSGPYPVRCNVPVVNSAGAYSPGRYRISDSAVFVDRFGNLNLQRRFGLVSDDA